MIKNKQRPHTEAIILGDALPSKSSVKVIADFIEIHVDPKDVKPPRIHITHRGDSYLITLPAEDDGLIIFADHETSLGALFTNGSATVQVFYPKTDND